ncbi:MAG: hypothetical protein ACJ8E3_03450 [Sphingomicrobium sp.]
MGCCSSFTAANSSTAPADPSRHVNFTTGMVLGVDDYRQEFVYHSARDKWAIRDLSGYGTLSGLAIDVDNDGVKGPRVRVSAGSAAAPSGQLICVGRDQCGSINAWLARDEVVEKLGTLSGGTATELTLSLFLTLCYVDYPVAEVPIPGEPCRSDENLMAPSRLQDDYCLEFRFAAPPPMHEAQALDVLTAFWPTLSFGGADTDTVLATALRKAEAQLRLAMGIADPLPPAADLTTVDLHPNAVGRFSAALKRLWVTRLRSGVLAQRCDAEAVKADDCLLLARLTVPIIKAGDHWEVAAPPAGAETAVIVDESERPLLLAASLAQGPIGSLMASDARAQKLAFITAADTITADPTLVIIRSDSAIDVKVPGSTLTNSGRLITIRSRSGAVITLTTPTNTTIDGKNSLKLDPNTSVALVSDGPKKNWVIASTA